MINLTKDVVIIKTGDELATSIKTAITKAKECICKELFDTTHIPPRKITSSPRNEYYAASIMRLFEDHLSAATAPIYDETWVHNTHKCAKKKPDAATAKKVTPTTCHDWLNKSSLERLSKDCILILHFLWQERAVLLPVDLRKPLIGNPRMDSVSFEVAAASYTEVLALVRSPFVKHVSYENIPDIVSVMNPSAVSNFEWNAWRMIRCTDWHQIEEIDPKDIAELTNQLLLTRQGKADWFLYPMAPAAFWNYINRLYPDRCKNTDPAHPIKNAVHANRKALASGEFAYPDEYKPVVETWLKHEDKFVELLKTRGLKNYRTYHNSLGILNTYLFSELPAKTQAAPPLPKDFNRRHVEGDGSRGLISFLHENRSKASVQNILYHIDYFFNHLSANSNIDEELSGFVNPIYEIDFPIVPRRAGTTKPAFREEHFPHLLQYCYAIEAFSTHLFDKVSLEGAKLYDPQYRSDIDSWNWNDAHKVVQTEKYGYVPVIFYSNPQYNAAQPKSRENSPISYKPVFLLSRRLFPMVENNGTRLPYPQLNYIRHNIVALETGIRSIHLRWLEKRTYDKAIDRSRPLPPLCKLHINTDKAHGPWDATVSKAVIEILDRQKKMISRINDPSMEEEIWYDHHDESLFGKIVTLFPKGGTPTVLTSGSYSKFFSRLIYSFDLFCRYELGIDSTNPMPEELGDIKSIETPTDYLAAIKLESKACKLIEHTPHSCRVSVVSEYIKILPPHVIGTHITGQATEAHVVYYAKIDPTYLKSRAEYQKISIEQGWVLDNGTISSIKAESIASKLQQAFRRDTEKSLVDFGAISFERETKDSVLSGIKAAKQRPIDSLAFMPTHICPFCNQCPEDVVKDLDAIPGSRMPCGGCYYSIKTVDHLPRIHGHIRVLTDECNELANHIAEARKNGASPESLVQKANHRKFLASEIISWSATAHCLEQMHNEIKTRTSFLIEKPEILTEHFERLELDGQNFSNLIARTAEAKSHAEFFTPQLNHQIVIARNRLLAFTGDFNRLVQEAPTGFTLIDEFRGLIRAACEVLGVSLQELSNAMSQPMALDRPNAILKLITNTQSISE